jgi:hypothetical protein
MQWPEVVEEEVEVEESAEVVSAVTDKARDERGGSGRE